MAREFCENCGVNPVCQVCTEEETGSVYELCLECVVAMGFEPEEESEDDD